MEFYVFLIDLQLFSEEKTEEATPKKKTDARKKGQVLQSREINSAVTLMAIILALKFSGKFLFQTTVDALLFFKDFFYSDIFNSPMGGYNLLLYMIYFSVKAVIIIVAAGFVAAFVSSRMQVGSLFTTETLRVKLERLNPIEGFKRIFSMRSVMELIKSLLKISVVGYVGYVYLSQNMDLVLKSMQMDPFSFSYLIYDLAMNMAMRMIFAIFIIAVLDYFYQRYDYAKNLRMSKQEIKEEYKMSEGDPQVKSKIKETQRQAAMKRMMQDVPKADVIITNPTHYAVAVKYDEQKYEAPYVIAKGKNLVALKIREKAKEAQIPIIENKPLAQTLYREIELGAVISPDLYEAVAEVLAYVYSLKNAF